MKQFFALVLLVSILFSVAFSFPLQASAQYFSYPYNATTTVSTLSSGGTQPKSSSGSNTLLYGLLGGVGLFIGLNALGVFGGGVATAVMPTLGGRITVPVPCTTVVPPGTPGVMYTFVGRIGGVPSPYPLVIIPTPSKPYLFNMGAPPKGIGECILGRLLSWSGSCMDGPVPIGVAPVVNSVFGYGSSLTTCL